MVILNIALLVMIVTMLLLVILLLMPFIVNVLVLAYFGLAIYMLFKDPWITLILLGAPLLYIGIQYAVSYLIYLMRPKIKLPVAGERIDYNQRRHILDVIKKKQIWLEWTMRNDYDCSATMGGRPPRG